MTSDWMSAEGRQCATCSHPASEVYADSVTDWSHGHVTYLCRCCLLRKQIALAEDLAAQLPAWRSQLETACNAGP